MSESQKDKLNRLVAEAVEARQHKCQHCGHDGKEHAFDIYPVDHDSKFPCAISCKICFDEQTKELESNKK